MAQTLQPPLPDLPADAGAAGGDVVGGPADAAIPAQPSGRLAVWALALFMGALFAAAILLWARNGVTVFFDVMAAGIAACF